MFKISIFFFFNYLLLSNFRKERKYSSDKLEDINVSTVHENSLQKGGVEKKGVHNQHVQKENVHVTRKIHQSFVTKNPQLFTTTLGMAHHNSILYCRLLQIGVVRVITMQCRFDWQQIIFKPSTSTNEYELSRKQTINH